MSYSLGISTVTLPEAGADAWSTFDQLCKDKSEPNPDLAAFCAALSQKYPQSSSATLEPTDIWSFWPIINCFGHNAGWLNFSRNGVPTAVDDVMWLAVARGFTVLEPAEGIIYSPAIMAPENLARFADFATENIEQVGKSGLYGCYDCGTVSAAYDWGGKDLTEDGQSYLCPDCRKMCIIGDASGMPMTIFYSAPFGIVCAKLVSTKFV